MSNTLYSAALTAFAKGEIVWKASGGSTVKAVIVDTANYTFSDAHTNLSQVPAAARVGSPWRSRSSMRPMAACATRRTSPLRA